MQNLNSNKRATKSTTQALGELSANVVFKMWSLKKYGSCRSANIHFKKFCTEVISRSPISETTVFLSLKYVQRYIKKGNNIDFTNEYHLFTIALMLANKWHDDKVYANKTWSGIFQISRVDIDALQISFLKSLNFKMHVTGAKYSFWLDCIKNYHLTGRLEYLFAKRIGKMTAFQKSPPKPGFNFDAKVIDPPVGYERNIVISRPPISETTVFLSLKYVQRYIKKGNNIDFTNEYHLFTIALMLANKWHDDKVYANKTWSGIFQISRVDIDALQISFLKSLNFKMHVTGAKYSFWLDCIKNYHLTGRLEYLFAKRIGKMTAFQKSPPKPGFNFDAKVIDPPVGYELILRW
ncbi:hypothetical protein Glove_290g55 [Diversispora epigaea]|uniref:Cyclin N-terminal domain-containing protein n=1 Tax=Diversispora epigaea TaxID=1348612 RepID=A0A397I7I9_9GLOM|nr:hypothetical protein Glove_290g55 [Diversispora epigaea]